MGKPCHLYQLFGFFIMEDLHGMGLPYSSPIHMDFSKLAQAIPAWLHPTQILVDSAWIAALVSHIISLFLPNTPLLSCTPFLPGISVMCCFSVSPRLEQIPPSVWLSSRNKCTLFALDESLPINSWNLRDFNLNYFISMSTHYFPLPLVLLRLVIKELGSESAKA